MGNNLIQYNSKIKKDMIQTFNKLLSSLFFIFCWAIPLSIGQEIRDTAAAQVDFINPSFESIIIAAQNKAAEWDDCGFAGETPADIQPGLYGCTLPPQQGKHYMGLVARDNNTFEAIYQNLTKPLKAGVCYRISIYLAKSSQYNSISRLTGAEENYMRPLKLTIWGTLLKVGSECSFKPEDWLAESLPIHNDTWRKYTFYIQPPKDVSSLIFSVNHVVEKPYNGNLLIDNISAIEPVNCTDLRLVSGGQKGAFLAMMRVSEVISEHAPKMIFGKKNARLKADKHEDINPESGIKNSRNTAFDQLLAFFEQVQTYKLIIRVKANKELSKQRIAFLYSYIFKNSTLKAQRVEIKPYTPRDEAYFWTFENDEIAISFDSM